MGCEFIEQNTGSHRSPENSSKKNYNTYSQGPLLHGKIYVYSDNWINKRNIMPLEALLV